LIWQLAKINKSIKTLLLKTKNIKNGFKANALTDSKK
jgi:hypothetical protein